MLDARCVRSLVQIRTIVYDNNLFILSACLIKQPYHTMSKRKVATVNIKSNEGDVDDGPVQMTGSLVPIAPLRSLAPSSLNKPESASAAAEKVSDSTDEDTDKDDSDDEQTSTSIVATDAKTQGAKPTTSGNIPKDAIKILPLSEVVKKDESAPDYVAAMHYARAVKRRRLLKALVNKQFDHAVCSEDASKALEVFSERAEDAILAVTDHPAEKKNSTVFVAEFGWKPNDNGTRGWVVWWYAKSKTRDLELWLLSGLKTLPAYRIRCYYTTAASIFDIPVRGHVVAPNGLTFVKHVDDVESLSIVQPTIEDTDWRKNYSHGDGFDEDTLWRIFSSGTTTTTKSPLSRFSA